MTKDTIAQIVAPTAATGTAAPNLPEPISLTEEQAKQVAAAASNVVSTIIRIGLVIASTT